MLSYAKLPLAGNGVPVDFAEIARLFLCVAQAEPKEEKCRLVEATAYALIGALWNEVDAASCYEAVARETRVALVSEKAGQAEAHNHKQHLHGQNCSPRRDLSSADDVSSESTDINKRQQERPPSMNCGQAEALRHFFHVRKGLA
ncbi:hypothetical protein JIQ42_00284 [Leishmania sp. Namibia]|uniref:hypothetical protein n=1 Tax=Leishmania sp. Namibia TaxID=2802991 RepID=UPI001B6AD01F|nr:hypothetical protein JIQ42_00284 [Leishmania sp. Namibia]